uniref:Putative secreted peptide n=1 Tax=Anopheles braziliensis TaxID=58242 RepID=A0A2M3ZQG8_9DIPT
MWRSVRSGLRRRKRSTPCCATWPISWASTISSSRICTRRRPGNSRKSTTTKCPPTMCSSNVRSIRLCWMSAIWHQS